MDIEMELRDFLTVKEEKYNFELSTIQEQQELTWKTFQWQCNLCSKPFLGFKALNDHTSIRHNITKKEDVYYQCMDCEQSFIIYANFLNHVRLEHYKCLIMCCDVCSLMLYNYNEISEHRNEHAKDYDAFHPPVFYCTGCPIAFPTDVELQHHFEFSHSFQNKRTTTFENEYKSAIEEQVVRDNSLENIRSNYQKNSNDERLPTKKCLTLKQKIEIIDFAEKESPSSRSIAKKFGIGKTQAALILKNKEILKEKWRNGANVNEKKSFLRTKGAQIDKICFDWFAHEMRCENGQQINGTMIKAKAKEIASHLGELNFRASSGWLQKWCKRNNIILKNISTKIVEDTTQEEETGHYLADNDFMARLPSIIKAYKPENIYNLDEIGLYYRALPNSISSLRLESCRDGKLPKERLTILFCVNMAGEKLDLLIIGNREHNLKNMPAKWKSNKHSWMTSDLMKEWLIELNRKMEEEKRQILLFLDGAASHPRDILFNNIKLIFYPPNTELLFQPLQQGITRNFKFHYRETILKHIVCKMDGRQEFPSFNSTISTLDALYFLNAAWNKISCSLIQCSFPKAGLNINDSVFENSAAMEDDLSSAISALSKYLQRVSKCPYLDEESLKSYFNMDDGLSTEKDLHSGDCEPSNEMEVQEEEDISSLNRSFINTNYSEALEIVANLKGFAANDFVVFKLVKDLEQCFVEQKLNM